MKFIKLASLMVCREYSAATQFNQEAIFVTGGATIDAWSMKNDEGRVVEFSNQKAHNTCFRYDIQDDSWSEMPQLNHACVYHSSCTVGPYLYVSHDKAIERLELVS